MDLLTKTAAVFTVPDHDSTGAFSMTPQEMKAIRKRLRLSVFELGQACGHTGKQETVNTTIRRYENGSRDIPPVMARLLTMFDRYGVPDDFLIDSTDAVGEEE